MSEFEAIQADVQQRGITRLCHFMQSRKLIHVLAETQAILPTQEIRERYPDLLDVTDKVRLDGRLDHVCCSVEYPNSWYFEKVCNRDTHFTDWIIIYLDPCLLWERVALFAPRNAAAKGGRLLKSGLSAWQALFQPEVSGQRTFRRSERRLACCPTDEQAEVLIPGSISQHSYIKAVVVRNEEQLFLEQQRLKVNRLYPSFEWRVAPDLFTARWGRFVQDGQRPAEKIFK